MSTPSKNILWLSISRVISLVLLFLAYILLTKYLGPYRYGQFQFVLSYVTLFGVIIDFGVQQYVVKKISEDRSQAKRYFQNFFAVEIVLSALVYAAMLFVAHYNGYEPVVIKAITVAGLGAAIHGLTYPFLSVITAFYNLKKAAFLNFLASLINVTLILVTIKIGGGIVLLTTQQAIYACLALIIYYQFIQKHIGKPEILKGLFNLDWSLIKTILRSAIPFALLVGFSTLYNRIDVVLITRILGYSQTGLYSAAFKFFEILAFFPSVVSFALYPLFASLMAEGKISEIRDILEKYLRFMAAVALPIGVGGTLLAIPIIGILSPEYAQAAPVLAIIVWAPVVLFMYIVVNSLVISQLTKFAMVITGVNVVVNIVGNLLLLPHYGIKGAAIMTVASEVLQGLFYFYFVRQKITRFKFFTLIWRPILASAIMGVLVWYIRDITPWPAVIVIGAVAYAMALFAFRFFRKDDIAFMKGLLGRAV
jgi:O-antigen/teichoic acid export membrane protein